MTTKLPTHVLEALKLCESDVLGETIVAGPREGVAQGATIDTIGMTGAVLLKALVELLGAEQPPLVPIESAPITAKLEACAPGAYAVQLEHDVRGVVVGIPGARIARYHGTCRLLERDELLLASGGPGDEGWALIDGPAGSMVIGCVNGGELQGCEVASPAVRTIAAWQPTVQHELTPPSVVSLTHGLRTEPWLQAAAEALMAGPSPVDRCAAVGLLGRFWAPVDTADLQTALQVSLAGEGPGQAGRAWWARLPAGCRQAVVQGALLRADELVDDLAEVRREVVEEPARAQQSALDWLRRRDDLESICFLARGTSEGALLEGALRTLDERAAADHSIWSFLPPFDDDRLRAVASADPDAWWGDLAQQKS